MPYMGQIINFSMNGMQVVLDELLRGIEPGVELENVHVSTPDGNEKLSQLSVQRVDLDEERGETRLGLAIDSIDNMSRTIGGSRVGSK